MKIFKYSLIISLLFILSNCTPDSDGSIGEVVNRDTQITGTWVIQSVSQVDLDAEKKGFPDFATKVDVTNSITGMPFTDFSMTIENGAVSTIIGNSPMFYVIEEGSGTWSWISDDEVALVSQVLGINASSGISTSINGQNVDLYLTTYAGINAQTPTLSLSFERMDSNNDLVTRYEYILTK